jgi:flagellar basal-body rod protein FlgG
VNGKGFFQILMPDGSTAYTRDGSFQVDSQGQVVTASGYPLQPALSVPVDALSVTVARDGIVTVVQSGSPTPTQVGSLQLANFINPAGLQSVGENLYAETAASGAPAANTPGTNGLGLLNQGYVETSNVNVVEEMVNMIQTQRAYEINSKAITVSDQMLQRLTQI